MTSSISDFDRCYRAVESRDRRFDGWFIVGVRTTRIYCRPSCPAPVRPKRRNVQFFATSAAAQLAGFRACRRCRPDAVPGSPEWDIRGDLVGRTMRLISDGCIDREGVRGVARRVGVGERHLHRLLIAEVGAGPLALARAQRAHTARLLIETTSLSFADVAFAAGFGSIRQFNDTVRQVYATTPTQLRSSHTVRHRAAGNGSLRLRLAVRPPFGSRELLAFLAARAVPGVESVTGPHYVRTLQLPHGTGTVSLDLGHVSDHVRCELELESVEDVGVASARCRRLLDLDADPESIAETLGDDPVFAAGVERRPGLRAPGTVSADEAALRAVVGQQVSVPAARTLLARMADSHGESIEPRGDAPARLFPTLQALAGSEVDLPIPAARRRTIEALADALDVGDLDLGPGGDRTDADKRLRELPGIGPWTAGYLVMRALGDPDVFLEADLGVRRGAVRLGLPNAAGALVERSQRWRPWRTYATHHVWASLDDKKDES